MVMDDVPVQCIQGSAGSRVFCGVCVALLRTLGGAILGRTAGRPTRVLAAQAELARGGQFAIMMRSCAPLSDIRQLRKMTEIFMTGAKADQRTEE
jgi:hypothetical protein